MILDTLPEYPSPPKQWMSMSDTEKIDWLWSVFFVLMKRCEVTNIRPQQNRNFGKR